MSLSSYISKLRKSKNLTVSEFSEEVGLSAPRIRSIENGYIDNPSNDIIRTLAEYTHHSPDQVVYDMFITDIDPNFPKNIFKYICTKYLNHYTYVLKVPLRHPLNPKQIINLSSAINLKRTSNGYTVVDSWYNLKHEYERIFETNIDTNSLEQNFLVLMWVLGIIQYSPDSYFRAATIIFENDFTNIYEAFNKLQLDYKGLKIELIQLDGYESAPQEKDDLIGELWHFKNEFVNQEIKTDPYFKCVYKAEKYLISITDSVNESALGYAARKFDLTSMDPDEMIMQLDKKIEELTEEYTYFGDFEHDADALYGTYNLISPLSNEQMDQLLHLLDPCIQKYKNTL